MKKLFHGLTLNILAAGGFLLVLTGLTIYLGPEITKLVSDPQRFRAYILSFGPWSAVIFTLFQILQVVIAVIPGEPVQIAGGYMFGTFWGTVYSTAGITVGYVIVFASVRLFGFPLVKKLVPAAQFERFNLLLHNPKLEATIFLLFLIPGLPKDILVYIAGLTPIKPLLFFVIVVLARTPAMIGSSYIGAKIQASEYEPVVIVSVIASILFVFGYIYQEKIIAFLHERFNGHKGEDTGAE